MDLFKTACSIVIFHRASADAVAPPKEPKDPAVCCSLESRDICSDPMFEIPINEHQPVSEIFGDENRQDLKHGPFSLRVNPTVALTLS